jgi:hypothetical protein
MESGSVQGGGGGGDSGYGGHFDFRAGDHWQVTTRRRHRYLSAEPLTAPGPPCGMPINVRARDYHLHVRQCAESIVSLWAERW